jgi:hypothetical protein
VKLLRAEEFFGSAGALPPEKQQSHHSPIAIRQSLLFLARQEHRTPMISPTKVGAQFLRHQLQTEVRSMDGFCCADKNPCHWL